jgi:hypothetical protein
MVHLVGPVTLIYYDARSTKHQVIFILSSHLDLQNSFALSHIAAKTWYEFDNCLNKSQKESSFHLLRGRRLKSRKV